MTNAARRFEAVEFHQDMMVSDLLKTLDLMTADDMRPLIVEMSGMINRNAAETVVSGTTEPAWVKARRLARELQDTLGDCDDGGVMAVVYPLASDEGAAKRCTILFGEVDWRWAANIAASDGASDLATLVEAHKTSLAQLDEAIEREGELRDAYFSANKREHLAPLTFGGGFSLYVSEDMDGAFSSCEQRIRQEYVDQLRKLTTLDRVDAALAEQAREALHSKLAEDIGALEKLVSEEKARQVEFGWSAAVAELKRATDAESETLLAMLAFPCINLDQCREKAAYLMTVAEWQYCYCEPDQFAALLGSFMSSEGDSHQ